MSGRGRGFLDKLGMTNLSLEMTESDSELQDCCVE